jgi:formate hydrogenlyase transcriptional activator
MSRKRLKGSAMDKAQPETPKGNILVVDDDLSTRETLEALLTRDGYEVRCAPDGQTSLLFAEEDPPELVLLDVRLPDIDGFQVCRRLKDTSKTRDIPVIFISGFGEVIDKIKGFEAGGIDYLTKPLHNKEVLARVKTHVTLSHLRNHLDDLLKTRSAELRAANQRLVASEKALVGRLRFEELLSDLSARFVNILTERVDAEIEHGLRQLLEFFKVDRVGLVEVSPDEASWQVTHAAVAEDVSPVPVRVKLPVSLHPWAYDKLVRMGEVVAFSSLDELPVEVHVDRQTWMQWGIRSSLNIPIIADKPVIHIMAINSTKKERVWPEEFIPRLRLLGEIFVLALERAQMRLRLEVRLRFEALISGLSARFVNLTLEEIDSEINNGLRSITEFFDADRCTIGLFSEDRTLLMRAFEYHAEGTEAAAESISKEQLPWYIEQLLEGNPVVMNSVKDLPQAAEKERRLCLATGMKSVLSVPLVSGGKTLASCALVSARTERTWPQGLVHRFRAVGEVFANAIAYKQMQQQLQESYQEIQELKQRLEKENVFLRREVKLLSTPAEMVGESGAIKRVLAQAEKVAPTDSTVLIFGETGVGKELVARHIHNLSRRKDRALVTVNCASLPPSLIESEIFGRERGAYTGALTRMAGRFEAADGSTLLLDEIGELPYDLQSKLLRVLEQGRFERLGSTKTIQADVRLIAATNRDLAGEVSRGKFRSDLYYRLNVFPINIPPLRERLEDVPALVWTFVREFEKRLGTRIHSIPKKSMESLQQYPWPGNIRELKNVVEHAMIVCDGTVLAVAPPVTAFLEEAPSTTLEDIERRHILGVLERTGWRISGKNGAAELLGMKRTTLQAKIKTLGITRSCS